MSVRTANRMLNRSTSVSARPFDACGGGPLLGGGQTLYSESGSQSQRSAGDFSQGSQDDPLHLERRRQSSSHVPKPPLFNTPKLGHLGSGEASQLPLDPACMHQFLRKVGDQESTIKTLQDRLTVTSQTVHDLTSANVKLSEEVSQLREQLASSTRQTSDALLASQRDTSSRMEQMMLQLQVQLADALAERSSPAMHKRPRRHEVAPQEAMPKEEVEDDKDEGEDEAHQRFVPPTTTYHLPPTEAATLDLFALDDPPQPLQLFEPEPPRREPPRAAYHIFDSGAAQKRVQAPGDQDRRLYAMTERVRTATIVGQYGHT